MYEDYWDFSFEYCMFAPPSSPPSPILSFLLCVRRGKRGEKKRKRKRKKKEKKEKKKIADGGRRRDFGSCFLLGTN